MRQLAERIDGAKDPRLLAGLTSPDDAAVFLLSEDQALVKTTDFFTPVVDDPYSYGGIAAANALSDVFAMGGEALFALNIAGTPENLPSRILSEVLAGGADKVQEAGGVVAGGHTITSPELFYGLSVTGHVHPDSLFRKGGLRVGDQMFLSKPLGTGLITSADIVDSFELVEAEDLQAAIRSMLRLNGPASALARRFGVRTATDVTGFGLLGHACEMLREQVGENAVGLEIEARAVPLLPHAADYVAAGVATRAGRSNREHFGDSVEDQEDVDPRLLSVLWEAETSGGLLLAVADHAADAFAQACANEGVEVWRIGQAIAADGLSVI